ncbi:MAG: TetR/AcrR family transcriptional regulator, partial [Vicinamibacterales bacterium]
VNAGGGTMAEPLTPDDELTALLPKTPRGERTRRRILDAAEQEIGRLGFGVASVSGITTAARIAQGTFYVYFKSKEDVLRELVLHMGRLVRSRLSQATAGAADRIDAERLGLRAFLEFVREHPNLYRVVEEAQFINESAYRRYYDDFAGGYSAGLEEAVARREIRAGDAEIRAWALMGMAKALGQRYALWEPGRSLDEVVEHTMDLICDGLRARGGGGAAPRKKR